VGSRRQAGLESGRRVCGAPQGGAAPRTDRGARAWRKRASEPWAAAIPRLRTAGTGSLESSSSRPPAGTGRHVQPGARDSWARAHGRRFRPRWVTCGNDPPSSTASPEASGKGQPDACRSPSDGHREDPRLSVPAHETRAGVRRSLLSQGGSVGGEHAATPGRRRGARCGGSASCCIRGGIAAAACRPYSGVWRGRNTPVSTPGVHRASGGGLVHRAVPAGGRPVLMASAAGEGDYS
jgi:hypothetical protein